MDGLTGLNPLKLMRKIIKKTLDKPVSICYNKDTKEKEETEMTMGLICTTMTVRELMEILKNYDADAEVDLISSRNSATLEIEGTEIMSHESGW